MRLLLAVFLLACLVAAKSKQHKIRPEKESYLRQNKIPHDPPPSNPHGTSKFKYDYLAVCTNGTNDKLLQTIKGENCPEGTSRVALGIYTNQVNTTGWGILEIETFSGHDYDVQAYAAGVAEGQLTKLQIYYHYLNTIKPLCDGHSRYCKRLYKYLTAHLDWLRSQVLQNPDDHYWRHVNLTFAQLTGMYDAYMNRNLTPEIGFDIHPLYMMQLSGELFDLNKYLNKTPDPQEYPEAGRCSGLVKIADNNADMFFSHVAMSSYSTMNRILKLYKFAYDPKEVPGYTVSFSGYPAALSSADDYTLTSAGLASIETTIAIFNQTLYTDTYIKPNQVHCWVRSFISNALTSTAKGWVDLFAKYNSGTYNNQWTVLDYKLFKEGQPIPNTDMLWILEQTPGYTSVSDMTWFLKEFKYWPSYNIPYLPDVGKISGFSDKGKQFNWYKWGASPRAKIFERDHHLVQDIDSLTALMRYNNYTHDEFSYCKCTPNNYTAEAGISARGDLNDPNGKYEVESMGFRNHGGLDYKGTNYKMFKQLRFRAWGGPPYRKGSTDLPPFSWNTTKVVSPHFGQPILWDFDYIDLEWKTTVNVLGFDD